MLSLALNKSNIKNSVLLALIKREFKKNGIPLYSDKSKEVKKYIAVAEIEILDSHDTFSGVFFSLNKDQQKEYNLPPFFVYFDSTFFRNKENFLIYTILHELGHAFCYINKCPCFYRGRDVQSEHHADLLVIKKILEISENKYLSKLYKRNLLHYVQRRINFLLEVPQVIYRKSAKKTEKTKEFMQLKQLNLTY